jgi:methylenetetrahydrofolate reductase (NADPH)
MRISIELVPRDLSVLKEELLFLARDYPQVDTINVPDMTKLTNRSLDPAVIGAVRDESLALIPHIRACDYENAADALSRLVPELVRKDIQEMLIVSGDQDETERSGGLRSPALISLIKSQLPTATVYAAIDPYRQGIADEIAYAKVKLEAGATGFFTQPFFDHALLRKYAESLEGERVFWGISPVLNEKTKAYWERVNNVRFPGDFKISMNYNANLAREIIEIAKLRGQDAYIMPIRAPLDEYLKMIWR